MNADMPNATQSDKDVLAAIFGFNAAQMQHIDDNPGRHANEVLDMLASHREAAEARGYARAIDDVGHKLRGYHNLVNLPFILTVIEALKDKTNG